MGHGDDGPPGLIHILETVMYSRTENHQQMLRFYDEVLGVAARGYRVGPDKLLIFNADKSTRQQSPPPHGTTGAGHLCFLAPREDYERWKQWLLDKGVEIVEEVEWESPLEGRSFYFHDPAGNVLEIADRDIWPRGGQSLSR